MDFFGSLMLVQKLKDTFKEIPIFHKKENLEILKFIHISIFQNSSQAFNWFVKINFRECLKNYNFLNLYFSIIFVGIYGIKDIKKWKKNQLVNIYQTI